MSQPINLATLWGSNIYVFATCWPLFPVHIDQHAGMQVDDFDMSLGMTVSSKPMLSQPLFGSHSVDLLPPQGHGKLYFGWLCAPNTLHGYFLRATVMSKLSLISVYMYMNSSIYGRHDARLMYSSDGLHFLKKYSERFACIAYVRYATLSLKGAMRNS